MKAKTFMLGMLIGIHTGVIGFIYMEHKYGAAKAIPLQFHQRPTERLAQHRPKPEERPLGKAVNSAISYFNQFKDWFVGKEEDRDVQKATLVIERVSSEFDVRTAHLASASTLDLFFQGTLEGLGEVFVEAGKENGISPFFLAAIALHESGNGSSSIARRCNNPMGILIDGKAPRSFESTEEAVRYMAARLNSKLYIGSGHTTVAEIQKIYCPVGAKNDPKSLNKYWLSGITTWMNRLCLEETSKVASR